MKSLPIFILLLSYITIQSQTSEYDTLLYNNVDIKGNVDYKSLKINPTILDNFLLYLNDTSPKKDWSSDKEKAFWINAYNAYTLKIVTTNYPIKSITNIKVDGKTAWKTPFVKVGGKTYTLDQIEHEILRKKFKDPRIHVGVNCASISCPKLSNKAFTENNIESELEHLMTDFINDPTKNNIGEKKLVLSEIFNWFKADFTSSGSLIDYINKYSKVTVDKKLKIKFLPYNWSLNEK